MNVIARLALSQLKNNKRRSFWSVVAIILATALTTCVCSFVASGNMMLVSFLGEDYGEYGGAYKSLLMIPAVILGLIIFAMAITVISNVFRMSASERISQFGTLKCIGATGIQIKQSIMYEGVFLALMGVPLGVVLGLCLTFFGTDIVNFYLEEINALANIMIKEIHLEMAFVFSWSAIFSSVLISFLTVQIAAWLPARQAAKSAAMESIRGVGQIAKDKKKTKRQQDNKVISFVVRYLFDVEGLLARKNIMRSKKKFKVTVITLTIGIILFTTLGALNEQAKKIEALLYPDNQYTVLADYQSARIKQLVETTKQYESVYLAPIDTKLGNEITKKLEAYDGRDVYGLGQDYETYDVTLPIEVLSSDMVRSYELSGQETHLFDVEIIVLDQEHYQSLCERAGVAPGATILLNHIWINENGHKKDLIPYADTIKQLTLKKADGSCVTCPVDAMLLKEDIPAELFYVNTNPVRLIVPEAVVRGYAWMNTPTDTKGYMDYANTVLESYFPNPENAEYMAAGFSARVYQVKDYVRVINIAIVLGLVLMYCFVGILMLIGFTNVVSTLSTNVLMRAKEFAVLKSMGMTRQSLEKMLALESILCALRAILWGVPISLIVTYLINLPIKKMLPIPYKVPLISIGICCVCIITMTLVITKLASIKFRNQNLIETIRNSNM